MKRPTIIEINRFQLAVLLNKTEMENFNFIRNNGVFCEQCDGLCAKGIEISKIKLDTLNDVLIQGTCNNCGTHVGRVIEFGEDEDFYNRAMSFRKSIAVSKKTAL